MGLINYWLGHGEALLEASTDLRGLPRLSNMVLFLLTQRSPGADANEDIHSGFGHCRRDGSWAMP